MNLGQRICEALGLEAGKIERLEIVVEAPGDRAIITVKASTSEAGPFVELLKTYKLVEQSEETR